MVVIHWDAACERVRSETTLEQGIKNTWCTSFQMYKLGLEKAEEPEIKLPTSIGSWKEQENFLKVYFSIIEYA